MFEMKMDLPQNFAMKVRTTTGRGFSSEELAQQCAEKIVGISDSAPSEILDQAIAFRHQVARTVEAYLKQAVQSDRTTVYNALRDAGHLQLADLIRRL